jgi:hypothetical protein
MGSINWTWKFSLKEFIFRSSKQIGGQLTNCKLNPKFNDISDKAISKLRDSLCVKRIEFKQNCPRCNKEFIHLLLKMI